ncbi:MAG: NAD-dependent epimerase/dehydratase family protein [Phycisphaerae bacterium]|nr:NAD-dependent epimerase/dehydratase family protein [Phycisphaerae bacterium]
MKILVSGATGFIGSAVAAHLESLGHTVVRLSRRAGENTVVWGA